MGAVAEYPDLIKNVFLTQDVNSSGIYALKLFIRGKPWILTIDDNIMRFSGGDPYFSTVGDSMWVPLLEKGWAKMKGTYEHTSGGWAQNGIRAFTGAPVFEYWMVDLTIDSDAVFTILKAANDLNYILGAGTDGADTNLNSCNIVAGHAYSMISAFELKTGSTVDYKLVMVRNPWGITEYNGNWKSSDALWTSDYISQVPNSVNPTTSD